MNCTQLLDTHLTIGVTSGRLLLFLCIAYPAKHAFSSRRKSGCGKGQAPAESRLGSARSGSIRKFRSGWVLSHPFTLAANTASKAVFRTSYIKFERPFYEIAARSLHTDSFMARERLAAPGKRNSASRSDCRSGCGKYASSRERPAG